MLPVFADSQENEASLRGSPPWMLYQIYGKDEVIWQSSIRFYSFDDLSFRYTLALVVDNLDFGIYASSQVPSLSLHSGA
jgi:hypothetical protein